MFQDYSNDIFDIIIQGGQSNSEGCGVGPVDHPFEPRSEILMMQSDFTIETACEKVYEGETIGNLSLTFADRYLKSGKLGEGRKLLILMAAVGGTGFYDHRWGPEDDLFLKMIEMIKKALALNPQNRAVAFVWHQGETDTNNPVRDLHYSNLSSLVTKVRQAAGNDNLPFIAGNFVYNWYLKNINTSEPIIAAIRSVCSDIGHAAFVETEGLKSNSDVTGDDDDIHFCREALYQLGHKYYDAFNTIIV